MLHRTFHPLGSALLGLSVALTAACSPDDPGLPTAITTTGELPQSVDALASAAAPEVVTELPIGAVSGSAVSGSASLTRSSQGLWIDLEVEGLTEGYAYSVWWAIFDNPQGCDANGCDAFDLRNIRQAQGSLVNGGGFVGTTGAVFHQSHLTRHDPEGKSVEAGDPSGVDNPYKAEVHVVIRSHGPAESDPDDLATQTGTFGVFCNLPDPPVAGGCENVGASMFMPPQAPGQGS